MSEAGENADAALRRPVWHCLNHRQADLAHCHGDAVAIDRAYGPFIAARDASRAAGSDMTALMQPGATYWMVEDRDWPTPPGVTRLDQALLLQMRLDRLPENIGHAHSIYRLGAADVPEMAALAAHAQPGPWHDRTQDYGPFFGVRIDGRLAAMAGQRMLLPGMAELSGVATHQDFRGAGLARALITHVLHDMAVRGEGAFLHSYAQNAGANALYQALGFVTTREMYAIKLAR